MQFGRDLDKQVAEPLLGLLDEVLVEDVHGRDLVALSSYLIVGRTRPSRLRARRPCRSSRARPSRRP